MLFIANNFLKPKPNKGNISNMSLQNQKIKNMATKKVVDHPEKLVIENNSIEWKEVTVGV